MVDSSVARGRQDRAYQEQTWAVALVTGFQALVLGRRDELLQAVGVEGAVAIALAVGALGTLFVWSRHAIYVHYEAALRREAPPEPGQALTRRGWRMARAAALWSGVTFYSALTIGLTVVAVRFLLG